MKVKIYDDFKDSKVCKVSLLVDFAPDGENRKIEKVDVRFKKILTSPDENGDISTNMMFLALM